jgi:ABC-2 type transport system permease protein
VSETHSFSVARGVAGQCGNKLKQLPVKTIPALLLPLFMFAAFGGALGALGDTPGFGYYNYTAFVFVFVLYMASMFSAVFTTLDLATDFENGFGARMMLAAPRRLSIVAGYLIISLARGLFAMALIFLIAVATGMPVRGGAADIAALVGLGLLLNAVALLYGSGVALRFQTTACGVLILIPTFMLFFVSPAFVPRHSLSGWLRIAADVNPLTPVLESGRGFLANDPIKVVIALVALGGLLLLFLIWTYTGMRKAERGPSERPSRRASRGPGKRGPRGRGRRPGASDPTASSTPSGFSAT